MREIFEEVEGLLKGSKPFALATVVRTRGSTPQKPGSKMLVREDGTFAGTLGGGCIEADAYTASRLAIKEGTGPEVQSFTLNDDLAAQDGLVCGGTMDILIDQPQEEPLFSQYTEEINRAYSGDRAVALAVITKSGALAGPVGSKLLIREDGSMLGTLGHADLDQIAADTAKGAMAFGRQEFVASKDGSEIYVEAFTSPPTVVLVGGGHVALAIYKLATFLGYRTKVVDDRPEFANPERFPEADDLIVDDFATGIRRLTLTPNSFIIVATRGHKYDDLALLEAVRTPARYVGLLGSKRKALLIYPTLLAEGVPIERVREIRSPIGLDLGGRTPESIALSIMAEVEMVRLGREGASMKMEERLIQKARQKAQKITKHNIQVPA